MKNVLDEAINEMVKNEYFSNFALCSKCGTQLIGMYIEDEWKFYHMKGYELQLRPDCQCPEPSTQHPFFAFDEKPHAKM